MAVTQAAQRQLQSTLPKLIFASNVQIQNTANTLENTILTGTIPGGLMSLNGALWVMIYWSCVNSTNGKTLRFKLNSTNIWNMQVTQSLSASAFFRLINRNSLSSQMTGPQANSSTSYSFNTSTTAIQTFAINTAADMSLAVSLQNNVAADTCALESIQIFTM